MKKWIVGLVLGLGLMFPGKVDAAPALGIHLLDPRELPAATELVKGGAVTVVLRSDERDAKLWQKFLDQAAEHDVMPIIRLATDWQGDSWRRPTKRDIVEHARFLSSLNWHADQLRIVMFNEPNHAAEWGGKVDAADYARVLAFAADWFHTEAKRYMVLPAGLDAAAPNGKTTADNLTFIKQMLAENISLINQIDGWTVHAYANPAFSGSPKDTGEMSIRSFKYELNLLAGYTKRDWPVYITEAGWKRTSRNAQAVANYYTQAVTGVWNDERVQAITPFVFAAKDSPFEAFAFVNPDGSATPQYEAWKKLKLTEVRLSYRQ